MKIHKILCIGGANVDWTASCCADVFPQERTAITFKKTFGGVAHNIAQNLKDLGFMAGFMSVVGNDKEGNEFLEFINHSNIDSQFTVKLDGYATASIIFVVGKEGKLLFILPRTEIYEEAPFNIFDSNELKTDLYQTWVIDTDLSQETIQYLIKIKPYSTKLYAVIACPSKSNRIRNVLGFLDGLFLNQTEASTLLQSEIVTDHEAITAAKTLRKQGVKQVFITLGERGVCVVADSLKKIIPAYKAKSCDTKGAGDAFASGVIAGLTEGMALESSVYQGLVAASLAVEEDGMTYGMLSREKIKKRREENG